MAVRLGTKKSVVLETEGLGPQLFHRHIVILVNEHTTGAAEMVTLFAKENSLAAIVGTTTPGRLISRTGTKVGGEEATIRFDPRDLGEIRLFYKDRFLCRAISLRLTPKFVYTRLAGARPHI
jgi:hypothetical protein